MTVLPGTDCYINLHMLDAKNGWVETSSARGIQILRTTDGARTWKDVTPGQFPHDASECRFPKPQTAWVCYYLSNQVNVLITTNGGHSWAQTTLPFENFNETSDPRFFDDLFGVVKTGDFGLGNAYYNFYETRDGGLSWQAIPVTPRHPDPSAGLPPGTFHLCNMCRDDVAYYPPGKFIVTYGDAEEPKNDVRLSVTGDSGKTWRDLQLPLPDGYHDRLIEPGLPVFFDGQNALLPVETFKNVDDTRMAGAFIFYRTHDGGETWAAQKPVDISTEGMPERDCAVLSMKDIILRSGRNLFVSHDGAQSWLTIPLRLDFGPDETKRYIQRMEFVDAKHGWIVLAEQSNQATSHGNFTLFETSNGGVTWSKVTMKISR